MSAQFDGARPPREKYPPMRVEAALLVQFGTLWIAARKVDCCVGERDKDGFAEFRRMVTEDITLATGFHYANIRK